MHTKAELRALLRAHGLRLRKRLGQHCLVDLRLCERLVRLCDITPEDTVVEIGAGLGALTDLLAARAKRVVAVEVDRAASHILKDRLANLANVEVRSEDILKFPWSRYQGSKVVGAIPYDITSPILVNLCEQAQDVPAAWLGLQREVAQRLTAAPGSKAYGRLTVLVQSRFTVRLLLRIPRSAFFPQPTVESAWVRLLRPPRAPVAVDDEALFFDVVRAAFSQRRKTLANCLANLPRPRLSRAQALALIREAGLAPGIRGEELSLEAFARLTNRLRKE